MTFFHSKVIGWSYLGPYSCKSQSELEMTSTFLHEIILWTICIQVFAQFWVFCLKWEETKSDSDVVVFIWFTINKISSWFFDRHMTHPFLRNINFIIGCKPQKLAGSIWLWYSKWISISIINLWWLFFSYRFVWSIFHFIDSIAQFLLLCQDWVFDWISYLMFGIDFQNLYGVWLDPSIIGSSFLKDFGTLARTHCVGKVIYPKSYSNSNESCTFDVSEVIGPLGQCWKFLQIF